jgi:S-adenosylmethionine:tRNA ribosyltransferase-isomerase
VYAAAPGAVAAPTAGLHFSEALLERVRRAGVDIAAVTLHVGIGTFKPVDGEQVEEHRMESERYAVSADAAGRIEAARARGRRVVAVGTTTVRTLETVARDAGSVTAAAGRSDLFIYPPFAFRAVDALLTNFHLPRSTLLMMVSAFAGRDIVLGAYREAIARRYRFYSYGDCMLIL